MSIKIDEHTVAGCPICNSTDLIDKSYHNHLRNTIVNMTLCNTCGCIFEPGEAVRISELPESEEVTKLKEEIKILDYRINELERRMEDLKRGI